MQLEALLDVVGKSMPGSSCMLSDCCGDENACMLSYGFSGETTTACLIQIIQMSEGDSINMLYRITLRIDLAFYNCWVKDF